VLVGYTERAKLEKAHEVLQGLSDGNDSAVRPVLEMLLEVAGRAETAKLRAAKHVSEETEPHGAVSASGTQGEPEQPGSDEDPELGSPEEAPVTLPEEPQEDTASSGEGAVAVEAPAVVEEPEAEKDEGLGQETEEEPEPAMPGAPRSDAVEAGRQDLSHQPQADLVRQASQDLAAEPRASFGGGPTGSAEAPIEPEEEPAPKEPLTPTPGYAAWAGGGKLHEQEGPKAAALDFSQTIEPPAKSGAVREEPESAPEEVRRGHKPVGQPSRTGPRPQLTFSTVQPKTSKSKWIWVVVGVVAVGGTGAGLLMAGVIGGGSEAPGSQGVAPGATDSTTSISGPSDTGLSQLQQLDPTPIPSDSLAQAVANLPTQDVVPDSLRQIGAADSDTAVTAGAPADVTQNTAGALPPGTELTGSVIVIEGLQIQSVTEFSAGGHRIVHILDSGEPLTLMAVPLVDGTGDTTGMGQVNVRALPGDSSVGSVRFGAYNINARGRVAIDVLQGLLGRLVVREP
jgi:hypothetical protein